MSIRIYFGKNEVYTNNVDVTKSTNDSAQAFDEIENNDLETANSIEELWEKLKAD